MARTVSGAVSKHFLALHEGRGTRVRLGRFVSELLDDGTGRVAGVRLSDGTEIAGDLVLIAAGVAPNSELAAEAGLSVSNGIDVDTLLRSSDLSISALGDCCNFPDPVSGNRVRLESVQAATDHARTIAKRLTGKPAPYTAVPWFWSDQSHFKLQIAGSRLGRRRAGRPGAGSRRSGCDHFRRRAAHQCRDCQFRCGAYERAPASGFGTTRRAGRTRSPQLQSGGLCARGVNRHGEGGPGKRIPKGEMQSPEQHGSGD